MAPPAAPTPAPPGAVQLILDDVRTFHGLGAAALAGRPAGATYDARTVRELAHACGVHPQVVWQARRFAALFPPAALERLLVLRRPDGRPLSRGHCRALLPLRATARAVALARRAAREGWSVHRLRAEVTQARGGRRSSGYPGARPATLGKALDRLGRHTAGWLAAMRAIALDRSIPALVRAAGGAERESLAARVVALRAQLREVAGVAEDVRAQLDKVHRRQPRS